VRPGEDSGALNSGAAYLFHRDALGWAEMATIKTANADPGDAFCGSHMVMSDDASTLVGSSFAEASGSPGIDGDAFDNTQGYAGAAYVFGWTRM
jgi:hypothetical protein